VAVAADIMKRLGQFAMRPKPPAQGAAVGMQCHQQDAVAPLKAAALILVCVVFETAHAFPPAHLAPLPHCGRGACYCVQPNIAAAVSSGLSSSARWPAPPIVRISVLPATPSANLSA